MLTKSLSTLFVLLYTTISLAATPEQFKNLSSCQLSTNPTSLVGTCQYKTSPDIPMPKLMKKLRSSFGAEYFRMSLPVDATDPTIVRMFPNYAKTPVWNADGTRMLLVSNGGWLHLFDGKKYKYLETLSTAKNFVYQSTNMDIRWSHTDPNVFYYVNKMSFNSYNISTHTTKVIRNFTNDELGFSNCVTITNGDEGNPDDTDRYWIFYAQTGSPSYAQQGVFVYDMQSNTVLSSKNFLAGGLCGVDPCPTTVNWTGVSHSGNYFIVNWNQTATDRISKIRGKGTEVYDKNLNFVSQVSEANGHADVAVMENGTEVYVGTADRLQTNGYKAFRSIRLSDGVVMKSCMFPNTIYQHISARTTTDLFKGWVLFSTYNQAGTGLGVGTFSEEIFALNLDRCEVRRIAHSESNWAKYSSTVPWSYYSEPHASVNWDFTKVIWGSNWRDQAAQIQSYVVDLLPLNLRGQPAPVPPK